MRRTISAAIVVGLAFGHIVWLAHGCGEGTVLTGCLEDGDCASIPGGCCRAGRCEEAALCNPGPFCGNNLREAGESCDGTDLGGQTCQTPDYPTGDLRCLSNCLYDLSRCRAAESCGNGKVDSDEECDGSDLAGKTCASLNFSGGALICAATCTLDTSPCTSKDTCGDGKRAPGEDCDLGDLGGESCETRGFGGGELTCASNCEFDTSGCTPADGQFKRMTEDLWFDVNTLNSRIDTAASYKMEVYSTEILPSYIVNIKNGSNDVYPGGIEYAHSKGIKFVLKLAPLYKWVADKSPETFKKDTNAQDKFYADFGWVLEQYPNLDGLYLEEPFFDTGGTDAGETNRAFLNTFFTKLKDMIFEYHPNFDNDSFIWTLNSASNYNVALYGFDIDYINKNRIFNGFVIQNTGGGTLDRYRGIIADWKQRLPNLYVVSVAFLTWQSLVNACMTKYGDYWSHPECWNQAFFDEVMWAHSVGQPVNVFILGRLDRPANLWPNDTTPGATAGEKLKNIWSTTP